MAAVTDKLCKLTHADTVEEEIVVEGHIAQAPEKGEVQVPNPEVMAGDPVIFEDENGVDSADAFEKACKNLQGYAWNPEDLDFYFNQVEIKMQRVGLKKQFSKLQALSTILPQQVTDQVKPILRKKENEFPNNDGYKIIKTKILRIFGTSENKAFERAMSRVLSDKPSTLAREIVNDMCPHELDGCCCSKWVYGAWVRHLPTSVRQGIAGMPFNADNFEAVVKKADDVFENGRPSSVRVAAVSAPQTFPPPNTSNLPPTSAEEFQYWQQNNQTYPTNYDPEVAAVYFQRGGRFQRGFGRGGRGQRGNNRGQQRGGANFNAGNNASNPSQGNNQGSGGRGGQSQSRPPYSASNPRHKGTRHPDLPPWGSCKKHFIWGKSAHMCLEPLSCPWANFLSPRPNQQ